MANYEIQTYLKLLCLRVDHFESYIVDEVNTRDPLEVEKFIDLYQARKGLKIIIFQMDTMEIFTFEDVTKVLHNAHVFDYMRRLTQDGHKMVSVSEIGSISISAFVKYLLS